ncbi:MAG: sugar kinase, partial [Firmicutes bacterium]|nr:sugar kinase [Bacillota bacterium]
MRHVLSMGEMMIQICPSSKGPLRQARLFERYVAGSEGNTLVGLELLGIKTKFISRVGADELGLAILNEFRARGVDVSLVQQDENGPTGVYFIQRGYPLQDKSTVLYYRQGSAASLLSEKDVEDVDLTDTRLVLLSGITPALSASCRRACLALREKAEKKDVPLAFDTNVRVALLPDSGQALELLRPYLESARYIFTGGGDLDYLFGSGDLDFRVDKLRKIAKQAEIIL